MRVAAIALISVLAFAPASEAQTAKPSDAKPAQPLSIEDVWKRPAIAQPLLSPNGRYFAVLSPINDRLNIAIVDLETRKGLAITGFKDFDVQNVAWVGNERLVYSLGQYNAPSGAGLQDGGGFFMVSRDGKESRQLSPTIRDLRSTRTFVYRAYSRLRSVPGSDEEIIAEGNMRSADSSDVYRLNVKTGRVVLLTDNRPERVPFSGEADDLASVSWVIDGNLVPRVAVSKPKDTTLSVVYYRKDAASAWEEIARYDAVTGPAFVPLYFETDNQTLLVATNAGRPTMAVYRYDPNAKKLGELVAQHARFDMGADASGTPVPGPLRDSKTNEVVGFRVRADKTETVWTDPRYQRLQSMIDQALPDTLNTFVRTPDGDRLIVTSVSDVQPARWYLLDEKSKTMEELFASRPWLSPQQLTEMRPFTLKTSDGLEISSYYFLPRGYKQGERLPTVVHIHGGPFARADVWGRWSFGVREAQLLASRGYAVILPNFRITPGLGSKVFYSGFGSYGRQMVQDHVDAAKWAIAQGFADPARICISGASYGGAAVLMTMGQAPDVFKCGIAGLVVSDMKMILTSPVGDIAHNEAAVKYWLKTVGAESTSSIPAIASPVTYADKIKGPVMLYAGVDDIRTPLEQTRAIQSALERGGNRPKAVVLKTEEGHGFGKLENNVDLYNQMFKFLEESIGPGKKSP